MGEGRIPSWLVAIRRPVVFLATIGGSLFVLPGLLIRAGVSESVGIAISFSLVAIPACLLVALYGAAPEIRNRRRRLLTFSCLSAIFLLITVFAKELIGALVFGYTGLFILSIAIATARSTEASRRPSRSRRSRSSKSH